MLNLYFIGTERNVSQAENYGHIMEKKKEISRNILIPSGSEEEFSHFKGA